MYYLPNYRLCKTTVKKSLFIKPKMSSFVFQVNLVLCFLSGSGGSEVSDTVENWFLSGPVPALSNPSREIVSFGYSSNRAILYPLCVLLNKL